MQTMNPTNGIEILTPMDARWRVLFDRLPLASQDIFYSPEYAAVAAKFLHKDGRPLCAALETPAGFVLYPFLERDLATVLDGSGVSASGRDTTGLYGRNGAVSSSDDPALLAAFHAAFAGWCGANGVVCSFDRFHPVLANQRWSPPGTKLTDIGGFVVADLTRPAAEAEAAFKHSIRKSIKKAEKAGVEVFSEASTARLDDYLKVYSHTMQRREARDFYYVDPAYYRAIAERLPGGFRFFYARAGGEVVSTELVLVHGHYCHSFLGGTLREAMDKCPNHLLKREIMRWARTAGCRHFLLGGGETARNTIWAYKLGFALDGDRPSFIGGKVHDEAEYGRLRGEFERLHSGYFAGRFQFYDRT
ncbi:MAG: GNAT family N-acetyltransferase [Elusimicrobia bacterium]|nr:GNAT family N-acetyltransferase [Elusimicrobiota bacterium]